MGAIRPLKVIFEIDPIGVIYYPNNPIMLDALIDWAIRPMVGMSKRPPQRGEPPEEITLPLGKWRMGEYWGWSASALFPADANAEITESIRYFRKRFRRGYIHLTRGMPNTQSGARRDHNIPYVIHHPAVLVGYCVGNAARIRGLLKRNVRYLGSKRHRGLGKVLSITVEPVDEDWSIVGNGVAMRWLPDDNGLRLVRLRPPYWSAVERVQCCEIGEAYESYRDKTMEARRKRKRC